MRFKNLATVVLLGGALAVPLAAQKGPTQEQRQSLEFQQSEAWRAFLAQAGGQWVMELCAATGTPKAIWGTGLALADWRQNSLEEARRHAQMLLREQQGLLGLGESEFREVIGARMGRSWSLVYDQYFRGLEVVDGRADVRINMVGRVAMFGSTAFQIPAEFQTVPTLLSETATAIAWQALQVSHPGLNRNLATQEPRLVIWGDVHAKTLTQPVLAWQVAVDNFDSGAGRIGRYYVDAHTGLVLQFANDRHECAAPRDEASATDLVHDTSSSSFDSNWFNWNTADALRPMVATSGTKEASTALPINTTVTLAAWQNRALAANAFALAAPLVGVKVTVVGVGTYTTDANGEFTVNISAPTVIQFPRIAGRHHLPIGGSANPVLNNILLPGNNALITLGGFSANATNAHATASYWVDYANEYCRNILGNSAQMNAADGVLMQVNYLGGCNSSSYQASTNSIDLAAAYGNCNNAAFASLIVHEWGHELDNRYGGISSIPGDGLGEGLADTIAMYVCDDEYIELNYYAVGPIISSVTRFGSNTRQYTSLTPSTPTHDAGEVFMGFAWKLRNRLDLTMSRAAAISVSNDIVIGSIVADATNQVDAVREVFIADDDDGNLFNGTPHSAQLIWACNQHSLPYPQGVANDECGFAVNVIEGVNSGFTTVGATASSTPWSCGAGATPDVWFRYATSTPVVLTVSTCGLATWDTKIEMFSGQCGALTSLGCNDDDCNYQSSLTEVVGAGTYYIRVGGFGGATGAFSLRILTDPPASSTPFGSGCGGESRAFYELDTSIDLNGLAMQLVSNGATYTAQASGSFVAPTAAAQVLSLGLDDDVSVPLNGTFPYPGGTTSSLVICSNGFVSAGPNNGTDYIPNANDWLASADPRWGTWHDFDLPSGGALKFEQVGNVAYVTWDGVLSYGASSANTWQLQFDLSTGNVTYVWQSIVSSGGSWLIGYASGSDDNDPGSMDISAALPGTFQTAASNTDPLQLAATAPQLGTTCTLTTTEVPLTSLLGIQVLSLAQLDPGISLGFLGMPGCTSYANLDALYTMLPSGGVATYALTIPNQANLNGFELTAQSAMFAPTANAFGFINSNGVLLRLGL